MKGVAEEGLVCTHAVQLSGIEVLYTEIDGLMQQADGGALLCWRPVEFG